MTMYETSPLMEEDSSSTKIAIIGMAGQFPGANTVDAFWQNLKNGVESIRFFTDAELIASGVDATLLSNPNYVKAGGVIENIDQFDASFFGYMPRDAERMDPQHRLFLECVWSALEHAGYNPDAYQGRIGVFAGSSVNMYMLYNFGAMHGLIDAEHLHDLHAILLANEKDHLATRIAYKCNLKGPAITIQTTCSTSLVATHLACQSLINGETDIALAGGVTIRVPHKLGYLYHKADIFSPDGHCRAFDADAQGTVVGNGMGVVVLKRLSDALADRDQIYAVILGSAVNNDGALKAGYTAPSEEGQAAVLAEALMMAGVEPDTVTYIEAHGTGTAIGDPIEIAALTQAYGTSTRSKGSCAIGSLKTNVGHLDVAAGVSGLIKTALALKHHAIPPSLHFRRPNPHSNLANSPFYVNTKLTDWQDGPTPRRAGVSSFGIGGTNAHVVLEEPPPEPPSAPTMSWQLLPLSAKTPGSLQRAISNLAAHLKQYPHLELADVAYTLQVGRKPFSYRHVLVCRDRNEAITALETHDAERLLSGVCTAERRSIAFMFPGQGTQYVHMARDLYHDVPAFREHVDICAAHLERIADLHLSKLLYPSDKDHEGAAHALQQTAISQPVIFTVEYALAQLWMDWGVHPQALVGHSVGEYVAACLAGVFSLEDALKLVVARGHLMQELPGGSMLAIPLPERDVQSMLGSHLALAAVNSPASCVVSGPDDAVAQLENTLRQRSLSCQRLHTSHAFHSHMMEPVMEAFMRQAQAITLHPPRIPYLSNVTGTWITATETTDPAYWSNHLRATVRFSENIEQLLVRYQHILLEVGPGHTLSTLVKHHPSVAKDQLVTPSLRHPQNRTDDYAFLLGTVGKLWLSGVNIDWERVHIPARRIRIPLPTYPFEHQRYWIEPHRRTEQAASSTVVPDEQKSDISSNISTQVFYPRPQQQHDYVGPRDQTETTLARLWQSLLGVEAVGIHDDFFDLGGDSFQAIQLINQMQEHFSVETFSHHIVEAPTIAKQAALIHALIEHAQQGLKTNNTPLVALKPGGTRRPLFLMHPAGGTVLCYHELARYLDPDQPLYGLQAASLYGGPDHETLEEVASYYLEFVRNVQPQGPYRLGGMSYGGNLAFEMSRQLRAQGAEVEFLALFDSHPPVSYHGPAPQQTEVLAAFPWALGMYLGRTQPIITYEELSAIDMHKQLEYVFEKINTARLFLLNMDLQQLRQFFRIWETHHRALKRHDPPYGTYAGMIALFLASEKTPQGLHDLLKINLSEPIPRAGWADLSSTPIQVHDMPGNHFTMLNQPHVQAIARQLNWYLTELE